MHFKYLALIKRFHVQFLQRANANTNGTATIKIVISKLSPGCSSPAGKHSLTVTNTALDNCNFLCIMLKFLVPEMNSIGTYIQKLYSTHDLRKLYFKKITHKKCINRNICKFLKIISMNLFNLESLNQNEL